MLRRIALVTVVVALAAALGVGGLRMWRQSRERYLFAAALPSWFVAKSNDGDSATALANLHAAAERWPTLAPLWDQVDAAWEDWPALQARVAAFNEAVRGAGLPYYVDVLRYGERPILATYVVEGRSRWSGGGRAVEIGILRRLDTLTVEFHYLGHSDETRTVVLLDRVEAQALDFVGRFSAPTKSDDPWGRVDAAALACKRSALSRGVGEEALARAIEAVRRRDEALSTLEQRFRGKGLVIDPPRRIVLGEPFFASLEPYTALGRPGGPVVLRPELSLVREADAGVDTDDVRAVLEAVTQALAFTTEAHEARHALEPLADDAPVAPSMLAVAGDDDVPFARRSERELRAYLGELHDGPDPSLSLADLAQASGGSNARRTPHHFAARTLLQHLSDTPERPVDLAALPQLVDQLCALPVAELRRRAAQAHEAIFSESFFAAERVPAFARETPVQ